MNDYAHPPSDGWTVDTALAYTERHLHELDRRMDERQEHVNRMLQEVDDRAKEAKAEALRVQHLQNEWRATVNDVMNHMIPRTEYQLAHDMLAGQMTMAVAALDRHLGAQVGSSSNTNGMYLIVVTITSVLAVLMSVASVLVALFLHYAH
jgi:hypothetical protein